MSRKLFIITLQLLILVGVTQTKNVYANEPWLHIKVIGADEQVKRNILAHLGELPTSEVLRRAFLFNVADDCENALESLGYYQSKIKQNIIKKDLQNWQLELTIDQGKPTRLQWVDIQIVGDMNQDPAVNQWLEQVQIKPNDILNHGQYETLKSRLVALALARGYFDGRYTQSQIKVNRDTQSAQINLRFESGKRYSIGSIKFSGHSITPGFIEQIVPFAPNTAYSASRLSNLNSKLVNTGYFRNIKVLPQIELAKNQRLPLVVELTPKPAHSIEVGLGLDIGNTTENTFEPRVRLTWRTPQINTKGHSQETSLEWAPDRPKFLTTYTIPLTHPLNDQLKIQVGLLRDKYGVTQEYSEDKRDYVSTGELESSKRLLGILRQRRLDNQWLWTYSLEAIQESYTQSDVDYDPNMLLFGSSMTRVSRGDNSLDPKSGFRQYYSVEYADPAISTSIRLTRFQAKFKWINTYYDKHRLVSRLDLGVNFASDDKLAQVPPSLRYFAGGDQSIRGYSYHELGPSIDYIDTDGVTNREVVGGRFLTVGSLEYQYYLTPEWRLGTFVDAGNAYDDKKFDPVVAVGGGVHWISPIGPIKLDIGIGLEETETLDRPWRIHLTMGAEI